MNSHRLGVQKSDGTIKLIASGSFDFCLQRSIEHGETHPDDVLICEAHSTEGYPADWNEKDEN